MSDILKAVYRTAKGLDRVGVIDKVTMRKFSELCLNPIYEFIPEEASQLRGTKNLSKLTLSDKLDDK